MKFLIVLCLLAVAAADEEKDQDKKTQTPDATQNVNFGLTAQPTGSLLNSQVFSPSPFATPISSLAYSGFNGNISPIQGVNPDFFTTTPTGNSGAIAGTIPAFTRTVIPATPVNTIQPGFSGVFPTGVNSIGTQFPTIGSQLLTSVSGVPGVTSGTIDPNTPTANGAISSVPAAAYRFLVPEGLTGIPAQGLQSPQTVGLSAIPAFTSGVLPTFTTGVLQGQSVPTSVLKNPTGGQTSGISGISTLSTGNLSTGPLANVFRQA